MFYVYVLESILNKSLYIGSTNNLRERFKKHNEGKVFSTKRYKPWKIIYYEAYISEDLARMREYRLKHHGNALRQLKNRIMKKAENSAGFTLIEIVLVMALIGVLATWMVSLIDPAAQFKKGRDAERKAELVQIQAALELYRADQGQYPPSPLPDCGSPLESGNVVYMQKVPCDTNNENYDYQRPTQATYTLIACLENKNDPQKDETNNSFCTGDTVSYTLTNP